MSMHIPSLSSEPIITSKTNINDIVALFCVLGFMHMGELNYFYACWILLQGAGRYIKHKKCLFSPVHVIMVFMRIYRCMACKFNLLPRISRLWLTHLFSPPPGKLCEWKRPKAWYARAKYWSVQQKLAAIRPVCTPACPKEAGCIWWPVCATGRRREEHNSSTERENAVLTLDI